MSKLGEKTGIDDFRAVSLNIHLFLSKEKFGTYVLENGETLIFPFNLLLLKKGKLIQFQYSSGRISLL